MFVPDVDARRRKCELNKGGGTAQPCVTAGERSEPAGHNGNINVSLEEVQYHNRP